jgi:hypothetical protein
MKSLYSKNPKKKTGGRAEKPLKKKTGAEMYQNRPCPKTLIKKTGTLKEKNWRPPAPFPPSFFIRVFPPRGWSWAWPAGRPGPGQNGSPGPRPKTLKKKTGQNP